MKRLPLVFVFMAILPLIGGGQKSALGDKLYLRYASPTQAQAKRDTVARQAAASGGTLERSPLEFTGVLTVNYPGAVPVAATNIVTQSGGSRVSPVPMKAFDLSPNDPLLRRQWALTKVSMAAAYEQERPRRDSHIAIVDTQRH